MNVRVPLVASLCLAAALFAAANAEGPPAPVAARASTTYRVVQSLEVKDLPAGAKRVRAWFWVPEDRPEQKVLDLAVTKAPDGFRFERDPRYGRRYLYAEAPADNAKPLTIVTEFRVRRDEARYELDPAKSGPITDVHRRTFAQELRTDERHMEVTDAMRAKADAVCGDDRNPVSQAKKIFDFVVDHGTDHYSLAGTTPTGKCLGDAAECLAGSGDCCTDQHALFIALARARGIPTRLHFGSRLSPANEGKDHDPGYRCWVTFFAPGYGFVPVECSAADKTKDRRDFYFGGLDDQRLEWAEGRDHDMAPLQDGPRPDLVIRAYVEVDGKAHTGFTRTLKFVRE